MNRRKRWLLLAGAVSLAMAVLALYFRYSSLPQQRSDDATQVAETALPEEEPASTEDGSSSISTVAARNDATKVATTQSLPPMPALDAPVSDAIEALLERAEAGDPEATCRVVLDFRSCWATSAARNNARGYRHLATTATHDDERANYIQLSAAMGEQGEINGARCEGMSGYGRINADFYDCVAAGLANLSPHQKVLLAMTDFNGNLVRLPEKLWPIPDAGPMPVFVVYPKYLTDIDLAALDEGIAAADPLALEGKMILHMPIPAGRNYGLREALPDAYLFGKYTLMMAELYGKEAVGSVAGSVMMNLGSALSEEQGEALRQEVDTAVQQWRTTSAMNLRKQLPRSTRQARTQCSAAN